MIFDNLNNRIKSADIKKKWKILKIPDRKVWCWEDRDELEYEGHAEEGGQVRQPGQGGGGDAARQGIRTPTE